MITFVVGMNEGEENWVRHSIREGSAVYVHVDSSTTFCSTDMTRREKHKNLAEKLNQGNEGVTLTDEEDRNGTLLTTVFSQQ